MSVRYLPSSSAIGGCVIEDLLDGIPLLQGSSNYVIWGRRCYLRLEKYDMLEFVKGTPAPPERHSDESLPAFEKRLRLFTINSVEARRLILHTSHLMIHVKYAKWGTAKLLWDKLRDQYGPLPAARDGPKWTYASKTWNNLRDCKYSGEHLQLFCRRYRDAIWLCEEADIKLDAKTQSLQFVAILEPHFPEWCDAQKSIMPTTEERGRIAELEFLIQDLLRTHVPRDVHSTSLSNFIPHEVELMAPGSPSSC